MMATFVSANRFPAQSPCNGPAARIALLLLSIAVGALPVQAARTDGCAFVGGVRLQDEVVVVSTRALCGSCDPAALWSGLHVEAFALSETASRRCWTPSDLESFLASDPAVPTVIFVHGNQLTAAEARHEGLALYRRLVQSGCNDGPVRFVIFSWPAEKVGGLLRDVRVKASRTGPAGCQLAWLLDQMHPETPVALVGFSFGARIITGGLHVLAGGTLGCGWELIERVHPQRAPASVVLIAAALDAHWLGHGQYHGLATTQVDRMLLLNSQSDLALRYYHLSSSSGGRPQALGLRGPTRLAPEQAAKICLRDVSRWAGVQHDMFRYLSAPGAAAQTWQYAVGAAYGPLPMAE